MNRPLLFLSLVLLSLCLSNGVRAGVELPFMDPIKEPVLEGNLTLELEPWLSFPTTDRESPQARINFMDAPMDGSGRLFVNDLRGRLYFIRDGKIETYLDARDHLPDFHDEDGLAGGLNFFTFHPEFSRNGLFYTVHTEKPQNKTTDFIGPAHRDRRTLDSYLLEWKADNPQSDTFTGSHRTLMSVRFPLHVHMMQQVAFRPEANPGDEDYGLLYVGIGEGGAMKMGQAESLNRLDSILGTIIRIDPSGNNSANGNYGIPPSNPWASDGDPNTLGEIWAYGFRNPHRFTWDVAGDGKLICSDIGEDNVEELNIIQKGRNYGWPLREGTFEFQLDPNKFSLLTLDSKDDGFTYPVAQFDHQEGRAVLGGYVYGGSRHPLLHGKYVFGEIVSGHLYYVDAADLSLGKVLPIQKLRVRMNGNPTTMEQVAQSGRVDLRLGRDLDGELIIMEKAQGRCYKIKSVTSR